MGLGYQFTDRKSFDYELWYHQGLKRPLRGPRAFFEDESASYWVFVGAAQTFGRFVNRPFPDLVASMFGMQYLNLGFAGAGPEFFANQPALLDVINASSLCFLQIMSGRSVSTDLLKAVGQGGVLKFTQGPLEGKSYLALEAYRELLRAYGRDAAETQVSNARRSWSDAYRRLIGMIKVPIICVWTSCRDYDYDVSYDGADPLLGDFPHLITSAELGMIRGLGLDIVGRAFRGDRQQLLLDYTTRKPAYVYDFENFRSRADWLRAFNVYYPTSEMHWDIARDLLFYLNEKAEEYAIHPTFR